MRLIEISNGKQIFKKEKDINKRKYQTPLIQKIYYGIPINENEEKGKNKKIKDDNNQTIIELKF